jgi:3-deoxy-D-arabino-heptulosonate 7-phosphate (DAHP) synthase
MSIEEVKTWQIDLEISLLTTITMLNQHGVPYENIIDMIEISVKNCLSKYDKNRDLLTTVFKKLEKENKEITEISINESNINNNEIITKINECEYDKFPLNCISRDYLEKDDIMECFILHKETRKSRL